MTAPPTTPVRSGPPAVAEPERAAGLRAWAGLAVLTLPTVLVAVDNTVLGFALPAITADLGPSAAQMLWMVDVYPLVLAGLLVTMGTLGDRIGRRRLLGIGIAGFGSVSLVAAFATDATHLIAARALLGFFGAMLMPSTLALLRDLFVEPSRRRLAVAVWATGFAAGAALGPVVGGLLLQSFWWGAVFLVNVPVTLLVLALLAVLPASRPVSAGRLDPLGVLLSLLTMAPLVLAVKILAHDGVTTAAAGAAALGVGAGVLFLRRARARLRAGREPLLDVELFASPVLRLSALANATTMFALTGMLFFSAQYLQIVLGLPPLEAGLVLVPGFAVTMASGVLAARLGRCHPLHVLVPVGLGLAAAGLLAGAGAGAVGGALPLLVASVLVGAGIGLSETLTNDAILAAAPAGRAGSASAVSETAYEVGAVLGTAVLGSVLAAGYRSAVTVPAPVPPGPAQVARETAGGAAGVADRIGGAPGAALLDSAREALTAASVVTSATGAVVVAVVGVTVAMGLRAASGGGRSGHRPQRDLAADR